MRRAISNTTVYSGADFRKEDRVDLVWEDGIITAVAPGAAAGCIEVVPGEDFFVTPGFVNAHFHPTQQLNRGLGVGMTHDQQMDLLHMTDSLKNTAEKERLSQLAVLEGLKSGTTCFQVAASDIETQVSVFSSLAVRCALALLPKDLENSEKAENVRARVWKTDERLKTAERLYNSFHSPMCRIHFGACNVRYCSDAMILGMLELAQKYGVGFHMHAAEDEGYVQAVLARTGHRPVEHLHRIGALNSRMSIAHAVKLAPQEIEFLAEANAHVVHCPRSNAYLGVGCCPVVALRDAGVNIALGSDAAINNNSNEVRPEAAAAFFGLSREYQRVDLLSLVELFRMLTVNGARAINAADDFGTLEPGKQADLVLWCKNDIPFIPGHDYLADLIFTDSCRAHSVYIAGNPVLRGYRLVTMDEDELIHDARAISELYSRAVARRAFTLLDHSR